MQQIFLHIAIHSSSACVYIICDAITYSKRPLLRLRPLPSNNELSAVKAHWIGLTGGWNEPRRIPTRTRSDDLTTAGRSERRTSRSSRRKAAIHRSSASKGSTQRPLVYAYNDNGSMVDVRCEPAEWTVNHRIPESQR